MTLIVRHNDESVRGGYDSKGMVMGVDRSPPVTTPNEVQYLATTAEHSIRPVSSIATVDLSGAFRRVQDVILEQHVRLFWGAKGAEFVFADDDSHSHIVNIENECLQSETITRVAYPAFSPDLNPVGHVWDMLG
ncbi:transposable element Tcb1 transposase [Trichonephila clavipes]|nr:transposable element Tcb1 transposase [Trichonephila clavipes]